MTSALGPLPFVNSSQHAITPGLSANRKLGTPPPKSVARLATLISGSGVPKWEMPLDLSHPPHFYP